MNIHIKKIATSMLQLMIEDDYCAVTESELFNHLQEKLSVTISSEDCVSAANFINSLYPDIQNIVQITTMHVPATMILILKEQPLFRSDYSNSSLLRVLNKLEKQEEEIIFATFMGLSRKNDELIYFDKLNGDVLSYIQGYFSSHIGDQSIANGTLANRITNNDPIDYVDEKRYILIDRLLLTEFLFEYKNQTNGIEPFFSYVDYFSVEILKDYAYLEDDNLTINDLTAGKHIQEKFHNLFWSKYQNKIDELRIPDKLIFENTCKSLALKWIKENVYNK